MGNSVTPTTPKPSASLSSVQHIPDDRKKPNQVEEPPTVLSEVAYSGPSKEDLALLNTYNVTERQQSQVNIGDVIQGFRKLGKDLNESDMLTMVLRALVKDETEELFDWLWWERFEDDPPADGKGRW